MSQTDHPKPAGNQGRPANHGKPWLFALLVGALFAGVLFASQVRRSQHGEDLVPWRSSFSQAVAEADEAGKPVFVMFTADWCGPCDQMKAWVYSDQDIADTLDADFVPVMVDLSYEGLPDQEIALRYGVQGLPTLIALAPNGDPIRASAGYLSKRELRSWLQSATRRFTRHPQASSNPLTANAEVDPSN